MGVADREIVSFLSLADSNILYKSAIAPAYLEVVVRGRGYL